MRRRRSPFSVSLLVAAAAGIAGRSYSGETGLVYVRTTPPGAAVRVDGESTPRGNAPLLVRELTPGRHTFRASLEGHAEAEASADVEPGKVKRLEMTLAPLARPDKGTDAPRTGQEGPVAASSPGGAQAGATAPPDAVVAEVDSLLVQGEYMAARDVLEKAGLPRSAGYEAVIRVIRALEARRDCMRSEAERLAGTEVTLGTSKGPRKGKVEEVTAEGVTLAVQLVVGRELRGSSRLTIRWKDLSPEEEDRLSKAWAPEGPDGAVARAYVLVGRKDLAGAERALDAVGDHVLAPRLRERIEAPRRAAAEAEARAAWAEIEKLAPRVRTAADAGVFLEKLSACLERHGGTQFMKGIAEKATVMRSQAEKIIAEASNIVKNGDFESGSLKGWEEQGDGLGLNAVVAEGAHGGKYAARIAREVRQTLNVQQGAMYLLSAWVKLTRQEGEDWGAFRVLVTDWDWEPLGEENISLPRAKLGEWTKVQVEFAALSDKVRLHVGPFAGPGRRLEALVDDVHCSRRPGAQGGVSVPRRVGEKPEEEP